MYAAPRAPYVAPGALRIDVILQLRLKTARAAEAAAPSRPAAHCRQQLSCITATSQPPSASPRRPLTACVSGHTSISQGPAGPTPMAFCSCPAPPGTSSPGCGMRGAGAAHLHQQLGPGSSSPACPGEVGSLHPAVGTLLLYIVPYEVFFSIFIDYGGFDCSIVLLFYCFIVLLVHWFIFYWFIGLLLFFLKDSLLLKCGFSFLQLPFNYL